jgi:predicted amidohydrolase YtcJ
LAIFKGGEQYLNSFGITSVALATGGLWDLNSYEQLRQRGMLTLRMRQSFGSVAVNHHLTTKFLTDLETARTTWHDDWISANLVKFFMDGAPSLPLYTVPEYSHIVGELDKRGYYIMSHALAPASAKVVLDGDEIVEKENGPKDRRMRMEHAGRLFPEDVPRFAKLGITPSMQPAFCCSAPGTSVGAYPPGKSNQWNSLIKDGAMMEFSSDWPCSWPPSPIEGIQQAVLRRARRQGTPTGLVGPVISDDEPEEAITAEQALLAYTRNASWVNHTDTKLGTLEAGKLADLAVLSKNILSVPADEIGSTKVIATMVGGKVVYGDLK